MKNYHIDPSEIEKFSLPSRYAKALFISSIIGLFAILYHQAYAERTQGNSPLPQASVRDSPNAKDGNLVNCIKASDGNGGDLGEYECADSYEVMKRWILYENKKK